MVGFILVIKQLRIARDQNSINQLNYFREYWNSSAMLRARMSVADSNTELSDELTAAEDVLASFMEDLGSAISAGQADRTQVWSYFSYHVEGYWLILQPKIIEYRRKTSDPNWYTNFEDLHAIVKKMAIKIGSPVMDSMSTESFRKDERSLIDFLTRG